MKHVTYTKAYKYTGDVCTQRLTTTTRVKCVCTLKKFARSLMVSMKRRFLESSTTSVSLSEVVTGAQVRQKALWDCVPETDHSHGHEGAGPSAYSKTLVIREGHGVVGVHHYLQPPFICRPAPDVLVRLHEEDQFQTCTDDRRHRCDRILWVVFNGLGKHTHFSPVFEINKKISLLIIIAPPTLLLHGKHEMVIKS